MTAPRKTGVIVGIENSCTSQDAAIITKALTERFPHVTFAVVTGASSVAFEWEERQEAIGFPDPLEVHLDPEFMP